MIKAMLFVVILTTANFAFAAKPVCSWASEIYKDKVSEVCRKEFLKKLDNEQDKIYAERLFKEWAPMAGYEVVVEPDFIQVQGKEEFLQIQWLSRKPAIAYINGEIVIDDSKDPSIYRQIERMIDKSEFGATSSARLERIRWFLFGGEANAASKRVSPATDAAFLYTVDGRSGTALDILGRDEDSAVFDGKLKEGKVLPKTSGLLTSNAPNALLKFFGASEKLRCDSEKKMLAGPTKQTLDGQPITITALDRSTFLVQDYPKGKTSVVKMKGDGKWVGGYYVNSRNSKGKIRRRKNGSPIKVFVTPCSGRYNAEVNDTCKTAWEDMMESPQFAEDKEKMQEFMGQFENWQDVKFGQHITCDKVFEGSRASAKRCRTFLNAYAPGSSRRYNLTEDKGRHQADVFTCDPAQVEKKDWKKCAKADDIEHFASAEDDEVDAKEARDAEVAARRAYQRAMIEDSARAKADKSDAKQADKFDRDAEKVNPLTVCPTPIAWDLKAGVKQTGQAAYDAMTDLGTCNPPPYANPSAAVKAAYEEVKKGGKRLYREGAAAGGRDALERRLMGMMMLGDCCANAGCSDKVMEKYNIDLKGGRQNPNAVE